MKTVTDCYRNNPDVPARDERHLAERFDEAHRRLREQVRQ